MLIEGYILQINNKYVESANTYMTYFSTIFIARPPSSTAVATSTSTAATTSTSSADSKTINTCQNNTNEAMEYWSSITIIATGTAGASRITVVYGNINTNSQWKCSLQLTYLWFAPALVGLVGPWRSHVLARYVPPSLARLYHWRQLPPARRACDWCCYGCSRGDAAQAAWARSRVWSLCAGWRGTRGVSGAHVAADVHVTDARARHRCPGVRVGGRGGAWCSCNIIITTLYTGRPLDMNRWRARTTYCQDQFSSV